MGSGFDDGVYWHFFAITVDYNSSYIELLNGVCLTNLYEESLTAFNQSLSQSHIATDGQSISKSWCQTPCAAHDQISITL
jgi:hypothetical protein